MKPIIIKILFLGFLTLSFSCTKFLEIDPPKSSLVQETIFQTDDQAISAVTGIYAKMSATNSYASGGSLSISCLAGLSSDELIGYNSLNIPFYENQLSAENSNISNLYSGLYNSIYSANAVLEGLIASNGVTAPVKRQLEGEAYFIRAFCYFYLTNLFGTAPLQLTTDYRITQVAKNSPIDLIYQQMTMDLKASEALLEDVYVTNERVRPNKSTAQALLARIYLYMQDWENAEKYASTVINKSNLYSLENLDNVFLKTSKEAIWQIFPLANTNAQDGALYILTANPTFVSLKPSFALNAFEVNDKRQTNWVKSITVGSNTYYYPFKYKIRSATTPTEYTTVLRLGEQYLIRAEARINQTGKLVLGIEDLNKIRERARPTPTITNPNPLPPLLLTMEKKDALLAVEQERKVELFTEWGHRWFDLKRLNKVNSTLIQVKSNWQATDSLYPFPSTEIDRNSNIKQNDGY
ncbi:hypothetical protein HDC92_003768 [Pedobacter sp. AK017]|uniref:RagB/SusD family nutrient uptake outer membrane protein n=1 Tax=Pedobacter sp. AK017 TaxID=2723073 RepID=UPI001621150B|nr:RagB/SusD family nutrient uptake outer membrane protein [Pedobacter sp. AK017]MBB5440070.1 hypothetical protein [Pedobacter sp. AK017]